jgi:hypothetical protein
MLHIMSLQIRVEFKWFMAILKNELKLNKLCLRTSVGNTQI